VSLSEISSPIAIVSSADLKGLQVEQKTYRCNKDGKWIPVK